MTEKVFNFLKEYWAAPIEILIIATVIYYGYLYFRGTRGAKVLTGLALIYFVLTFASNFLHMEVISWIFNKLTMVLATGIVIIFHPEIRRALAGLGSHHIFSATGQKSQTLEVLTQAVFELSHKQIGALIALEKNINLQSYADTGTTLDSMISSELIQTIFNPKTPLHDGGLIIRNDRILAAGCIFPVSQRQDIDRTFGLRHRAGLGISEESDAIVIIVSEETGLVSICSNEKIDRDFVPNSFKTRINQLLLSEKHEETHSSQLES